MRTRRGRPGLRRHRRLHRRAALPAGRPDLGGPRRRAQHEGHRADRRLPRRQAVPAHQPATSPPPSTDDSYRAALDGKTMVVFGGSYGIGADIADLAGELRRGGLHVQPLRDQHPRRAPRGHRRGSARTCSRRPAGSTSSSTPPACCREALSPRPPRRPSTPPPRSTTSRRSSSPRSSSRTCSETQRQPAAVHLELLHPGPQRLQPLLLGEGGGRQPDPGARRRVGRRRGRVNCINPERTATPMRTKAFGAEPADSLLDLRRSGPCVAGHAGLRPDRPHRRHPAGGPAGRTGGRAGR